MKPHEKRVRQSLNLGKGGCWADGPEIPPEEDPGDAMGTK